MTMSIASNETDKQVGAILEAMQNAAPEVIKQAMAYNHMRDIVGLVGFVLVTVMLIVMCCVWGKKANAACGGNCSMRIASLVSGIAACVACFIAALFATDLTQLVCAPDYYAAGLAAQLGRTVFGGF
jgi:hypothetical protein